jgi:hypothetical protein
MSVWRLTRDEVAGAWRSLRYDLHRRPAGDARRGQGFAEVTSTGLNTFAGGALDEIDPAFDEFDRPRRRRVAVAVFGTLALLGAAGSYFAVVHGLGVLLAEPTGRQPFPLAAEAGPAPAATGRPAQTARLGHGTWIPPLPLPRADPPRLAAPSSEAVAQAVTEPDTPATRVPHTMAPPSPSCRCLPPPVPRPTSPPSGDATGGYPPVSASPSPSVSASSPTPGPSATASGEATARPRHTRGY